MEVAQNRFNLLLFASCFTPFRFFISPGSIFSAVYSDTIDVFLGPLEVIKSCDRYCSGIAILSTKPEKTREKFKVS